MSRLNRLVLVAMPRAMALGLAVLSAMAQSSSAFEPGPPVESPAPDVEATDQDGRTRRLSSLLGPSGAFLVFYRVRSQAWDHVSAPFRFGFGPHPA